jgi:DNA excision repair protein ERCC-2
MKKKFKLGVVDFALPAPRTGSIDTYSGFGNSAELGLEIHQKIQFSRKKKFPLYQAEVRTSHQFVHEETIFDISGRMDGVFNTPKFKIEEIKTAFNIDELLKRLQNSPAHPYQLQLKTYGYIHWLKTNEIPDLVLHLVSSRNAKSIDMEIELNIKNYEQWLALRLAELAQEALRHEKRIKRRKCSAQNLIFPYPCARPGQTELIAAVEEAMQDKQRMLIQAPTGLGKTVGVLYPVLKEALSRGQKVIYLTPKNSQHAIAEEAVSRLQMTGAAIKSMTLTAKSKMCFKSELLCNPEYCEFANNHYTKVAASKLSEKLARKKLLTAKVFKALARKHEVCPFELQMEAIADVETVICDYNYVFSPHAGGRLTHTTFTQSGKPNLIIDEAHNLPARAMDYYSPALSSASLEQLSFGLEKLTENFSRRTHELIQQCLQIIKECVPPQTLRAVNITPAVDRFIAQEERLQQLLSAYLESDAEIAAGDPIMQLCRYWSDFTAALEFIVLEKPEFFTTYDPRPPTLRITCCDAAEMLKNSYHDYAHVAGFSATLKPFDFYSRLSGLDGSIKTAEFTAQFPPSNRKILIIPQISSKYAERERNYPRIAEAIHKIAGLKFGNYFAFFPSFEFLERVLEIFIAPAGFNTLRQARGMRHESIADILAILKSEAGAHILFAVQGGIFSEGLDYPGNMAIGVFIVGPPLPNFDLKRESMKKYYEEKYAQGFDYTYTYPAMAKAIQAAGRVIRSETDKGIIILMDNRFLQPSYSKCMPQDWFQQSAHEKVSDRILSDIADFWTNVSLTEID